MAYALPHEIREGKSFIVSPSVARIIILPTGRVVNILSRKSHQPVKLGSSQELRREVGGKLGGVVRTAIRNQLSVVLTPGDEPNSEHIIRKRSRNFVQTYAVLATC